MANKYGISAVIAARAFAMTDPLAQWKQAVATIFPMSVESQKKGCPRSAFLGLCEAGYVRGIASGKYTTSQDNKAYAIRAIEILQSGYKPQSAKELWLQVMNGRKKAHNSQADVVLALWDEGLIEN
jgi:hypothetical protein